MSLAWETSTDDILNVFRKMGHEGNEEQAEDLHDKLDHDRIEQAALCGTAMEDQVAYAYADIEEQIKELYGIP